MSKEKEIKVEGVDLGEAVVAEVTVPAETKQKKSYKGYAKDALLIGVGFLGGTIFGYHLGKSKSECDKLEETPAEPQPEQPRGEVVEVRLPQRNGGFHHRKFNNENNQ